MHTFTIKQPRPESGEHNRAHNATHTTKHVDIALAALAMKPLTVAKHVNILSLSTRLQAIIVLSGSVNLKATIPAYKHYWAA